MLVETFFLPIVVRPLPQPLLFRRRPPTTNGPFLGHPCLFLLSSSSASRVITTDFRFAAPLFPPTLLSSRDESERDGETEREAGKTGGKCSRGIRSSMRDDSPIFRRLRRSTRSIASSAPAISRVPPARPLGLAFSSSLVPVVCPRSIANRVPIIEPLQARAANLYRSMQLSSHVPVL